MKLITFRLSFLKVGFLIAVAVSLMTDSFALNVRASPASAYYYKFTVNKAGFTDSEINFSSTDISGESWVFVPKNVSSWTYTVTSPSSMILESDMVETNQISGIEQNYYFYRAFKFSYQSNGIFNMTIRFGFDNGALIIERRGIFYSPQIGFKPESNGKAEVIFHHDLKVNREKAIATGLKGNYPASEVGADRAVFDLEENIVRLQVELAVESDTPDYITLQSNDNKTFIFKTPARYETYARKVLKLFDQICTNLTRLFNVTLENIAVQFFLPDFETLLAVGGFIPYTGEQLGEININVVFIRAVNGTVEVIATHELVHRFLGKAAISPGNFLWFHEGMAQYISITTVVNLNYEGAQQEKDNLENGSSRLIQQLGSEDFSSLRLQYWRPSYQPSNVDIGALYVASYYVVSRLPQKVQRSGLDYYEQFFKLIKGVMINNINVLTLYLSMAANASVARTLQRWGFSVADLYNSPVSDLAQEASKAIEEVNPVFQPYRFFAETLYQQALISSERGDWERTRSLLQLSITMANLAPLLTFLTIVAALALLVFILSRRRERPPSEVPVPPPEILQRAL